MGTSPGAAGYVEYKQQRTKSQSESDTVIKTLMAVDPKNLNPENEMKKIFGSRVVLAEQRQAAVSSGGGAGGNTGAAVGLGPTSDTTG